jgi:hypothetical protein
MRPVLRRLAEEIEGGAGQHRRTWLGAEVLAARAVRGRCRCRSCHVSKGREAGNCRCGPEVGAAGARDVRLTSGARQRREQSAGGAVDLRGE